VEPCGSASRGVLVPTNATTSGAPSPSNASLQSRSRDEGRQTLVGAVLRVLAPLDGSGNWWLARGLLDPAVRHQPPTLRGLLSCRSRPWNFPSELSLPEEPYPLSRALLLPCEFALDRRQRNFRESFTTAFTDARQLFARPSPPKWTRGRMSQDAGSPRSLGRSPRRTEVRRTCRRSSLESWARRLTAATPASKLCSPRESVQTRPPPREG
jgi:hypothetical protein